MYPQFDQDLKLARRGCAHDFPPLLLPLEPAFRAIGVRRTKGYALIASGALTMVKIGGKSLITTDSLLRFAASLPPVPVQIKG